MCGRFTIATKKEKLIAAFPYLAIREAFGPRFNVAPSQNVPVILNTAPAELTTARWGLIPHWAKDEGIANKLINARAETVAEKPAFRDAFKRQRCLILADGFYEWVPIPGTKLRKPYLIRMRDGGVFTFAGLWNRWHGPEGERLTCTIITTTPNELMAPLHDRMPAIVQPADRPEWLAETPPPPSFLAPHPAEPMEAFPVSDAVNRAGIEDPKLIERVPLVLQSELL